MLLVLRLALRNLTRHFRRSLITILSIGFALAVILWLQAILAGSNKNIIDTITSTSYGHMQIFRADYQKDHLIQQTFPLSDLKLEDLASKEHFEWAPRLILPSLISSGEQSFPIVLEGIDPAREAKVTNVRDNLAKGEFLRPEENGQCTHAVYMSRSLARLLNVKLGNKVVLLAQASDGTLGNELLRIKGLFDSGSPDYDKGIVFTTLPCVRQIGVLKGVHEIAVHVSSGGDEVQIRQDIKQRLPQGLTVMTWRQIQPRLAAMTNFNDASLILVSLMLFIVISLGILNTFLVTVFERTTEFGVMMALGTAPWRIVALVLSESLFLGLAASLIGILVGAAVIAYHYHTGFDLTPLVGNSLAVGSFKLKLLIYPIFNLTGALKAVAITLLVVLAAAIYPAIRASRLRPIDAIRSV